MPATSAGRLSGGGDHRAATVVGLGRDLASPEVRSKKAICEDHPSVVGFACFIHHLSLMTKFFLTNPPMRLAAV